MKVILYRAATEPEAGSGSSFSPNIEVAKAYLDNPGFGGPNLYKYVVEVDEDRVLRLYEEKRPLRELAESIFSTDVPDGDDYFESPAQMAKEEWRQRGLWTVYQVLMHDEETLEVVTREYDWVTFTDDFPNVHPPPETWWRLKDTEIVGMPIKLKTDQAKIKAKLMR